MSEMLDTVASIADHAAQHLPAGEVRRAVLAVRERLDEPLRVAVAGRVSAGKSTLVNALIGQRVVAVGAGECTRVVTWLCYGHVDEAHAELADGQNRAVALTVQRSLPSDIGVDPADVLRLQVRLYNDALKQLTLVDTPGLQSMSEGVSARSVELLGLGTATAVAEVDALLYVVSGDLRCDDEAVIEDFARHTELAGASAANTALAITKVDRIINGADRHSPDAVEAMVERWRERLGPRVCAVSPVVGLLAETALCGRLDEERAAMLRDLARVQRVQRESWLRSPRRFLAAATVPPSPEDRADLLRRLDVFGLRRAAELAELGVGGASGLTRELGDLSGIHSLRSLLATAFTARADLLKADAALRALRALTRSEGAAGPSAAVVREALVAHGDRLVATPDAQRLRELEVLRELTSGDLALPDPLSAAVHRLTTGATSRQRLNLPAETPPEHCGATAAAMAAQWRRFQFDGRRTAAQRRAAHVVALALAGIAREMQGAKEGAAG
jgi:predicted GTPase